MNSVCDYDAYKQQLTENNQFGTCKLMTAEALNASLKKAQLQLRNIFPQFAQGVSSNLRLTNPKLTQLAGYECTFLFQFCPR